ncbi:MAG TPA: prolyl oligopeptidase family serine peptidase [Gemmatimonadaceae bacterium]|nr:prolyl oligopeptidase family serine peptidase [Gemmatimonadaceae bacterium]
MTLRIVSLCGRAMMIAGLLAAPLTAQTVTQQGWDPQAILRTETYVKPPAVIERIVMAPRIDISFANPSPDRKWFIRTPGSDRGDIDKFGAPHVNLGGLQIDTRANRARTVTTSQHSSLAVVDAHTGAERALETPKSATISSPVWSPAGNQIAYLANFDDASYVYVADLATGKSVRVAATPVLATLVTTLDWTSDGKNIVTVLVPDARGPLPTHGRNGVETGPQVRLTESRALPQVIHPALLEDPHDKAQLEYYTTGQLALVDAHSKTIRKIGAPAMIRAVDISPDGRYFRVTTMTKPFSYIVPVSSFGSRQEVWDATGAVIASLGVTPLREGTPDDALGGRGAQSSASDTGKRNIQWNPAGPGLTYLQSVFGAPAVPVRGGRPSRPQPTSVRLMGWAPPFGPGDTKVLYEGSGRMTNAAFGADGKALFVADSGSVSAVSLGDPSHRSSLGRGITLPGAGGGRGGAFGAPDTAGTGALVMTRAAGREQTVMVSSDGKSVYVGGTQMPASKWQTQAPRPWVDRVDIATGERKRVFESPATAFDEVVAPLDDDYNQFIYTHESATTIPDAFLRDVRTGATTQLTHDRDVAPEVTGARHERMQVTRPRDGIRFWVDVTLPKEWQPGKRMPGIIWFYPREYTSQAEYDRSRYNTNINKFPALEPARPASSVKLWVTQGYVLLEPDSPIMGDSGRMNDNYSRDLRENLDAVIDAAVAAGYVDRDHMGLGGHSYGAFSTVNGLTLTPYFKAGIAGDGMYNRSLTPFGFQSERRNFFEAQSTYLDMSPFYRADKIHGALLMYHALEDQNVGTAPISSVRMFHALQGLGKPAALYMYPYEDHSDATYATDLDIWARWVAWFDTYVKGNGGGSVTP